ncbi:MAG: hypothetical protein ACO200_12875 [Steroidobacteraceae bacterium]
MRPIIPATKEGIKISIEVYRSDELLLLDSWFCSAPIDEFIDRLLCDAGSEEGGEPYTRLAPWEYLFDAGAISRN